jgi:hypothetical protein
METYFVMHQDEDGDMHFDCFDKETLENKLNNNWWGSEVEFSSTMPKPGYGMGGKLYIIKGEMITPKPVQKVTSYEV